MRTCCVSVPCGLAGVPRLTHLRLTADNECLPYARKHTGADMAPWGGAPQDGVWDGQRLLPEGWVRASTSPTPAFPQYGAGWWLDPPLWLPGAHAAPRRPRASLSGRLLVVAACRAGALASCSPAPVGWIGAVCCSCHAACVTTPPGCSVLGFLQHRASSRFHQVDLSLDQPSSNY